MDCILQIANTERIKKVGSFFLQYIGYIILFVLFVGVYCYIFDRRMFWDIFPPAGRWNDEAFYYKQIESMIEYGFPRGYFGYDESHAQILTFGAWSFVVLLPYIAIGKVLGWNYFMPVFVNMLMFASAIFIYAKVSGATVKERVFTYCIYGAFGVILRYILSGMVESVAFSICIVIISLTYKVAKNTADKNKLSIWILIFLCFIATVIRPYFVILFFYPFCFSVVRKKRGEIVGTGVLSITSFFVVIGVNKYLCAPYFNSTQVMRLSFVDAIREDGILAGIQDIIGSIMGNLEIIKSDIFNMIKEGQCGLEGKVYLFFGLEFLFLIILFIKDIKKKQIFPLQAVRVITIGFFLAVIAAVLMFYQVGPGARNILTCLIIGTIVLMMGEGTDKIFPYSVVIIICMVGMAFRYNDYIKEIPYRTNEWNNMITEDEAILYGCIEVDPDAEKYWDNTVAYEYGVPYNDLYGMPAGIGIQIDRAEFLLDMGEPINSKYLMVAPDGDLSKCLTDLDAVMLGRTDRFEVFLNPEVPLYRVE